MDTKRAKIQVICTALGADRVGIVEELSAKVLALGCNIEESSMSILGDDFAIISLISGNHDQIKQLYDARQELADQLKLSIHLKETAHHKTYSTALPYTITCITMDHPGIVHLITKALRDLEVNIQKMHTATYAAAFSGAPLFKMEIIALVPAQQTVALREKLLNISQLKDLDITVQPNP